MGEDDALAAERLQGREGEVHAVCTPALVVVGAALHDRDRTACEAATRHAAAGAGDRRLGKARQVGVEQGDRRLQTSMKSVSDKRKTVRVTIDGSPFILNKTNKQTA